MGGGVMEGEENKNRARIERGRRESLFLVQDDSVMRVVAMHAAMRLGPVYVKERLARQSREPIDVLRSV